MILAAIKLLEIALFVGSHDFVLKLYTTKKTISLILVEST